MTLTAATLQTFHHTKMKKSPIYKQREAIMSEISFRDLATTFFLVSDA